jgi:lipopolysaccharide export system protein LptA
VNNVTIGGDYAEHFEKTDSSFATGHALMTQLFDSDTLFLHSDTLMAVAGKTDTAGHDKKHMLFAFHKVKIFKTDLQGTCDSLVYNYRDSTIRLFRRPVLWSGQNQLTADSIHMQLANSDIDRIYMSTPHLLLPAPTACSLPS